MPTYTIVGVTGNTGSELFKQLIKKSDVTIHAYCRSKSKFFKQQPEAEYNERVKIFQGALTDVDNLAAALSPAVDACFNVIGQNENVPGMRIAQESSQTLVAAMCQIRNTNPNYKPPRLILLSSASLNPRIYQDQPMIMHNLAATAFSHAYADLRYAEEFLRQHSSWLDAVFIQPGALTEDIGRGHKLALDKMSPFVSYPDLAAGMIEVVETGGYSWEGVAVVATSKDVQYGVGAPKALVRGLVWHYLPWMYGVAKSVHLV